MNNNVLFWIWLKLALDDKVTKVFKTYQHFKTIENAYNCTQSDLEDLDFLTDFEKSALLVKDLSVAQNIVRRCQASNIKIITVDDDNYPNSLKQINSYPCVLFCLGDYELLFKKPLITVVGTRKCTSYGEHITSEICANLSLAGFGIVTGVATGIDSSATKGVLSVDGSVIAVLPGGHATTRYGTSYKFKDILRNGVVLSEHLPDTPTGNFAYQQRNRILSALSLGTLVTQAPKSSGALMTATYALEQGKDVFAVMANINMAQSMGSNLLIKDGAIPVLSFLDIVEQYIGDYADILKSDIPILNCENNKEPDSFERHDMAQDFKRVILKSLDEEERIVFDLIKLTETDIDYIIGLSNLPVSVVMSVISSLETKGAIIACPGNKYKLMI